MPKRKEQETPEEQSERFLEEAQKLIDAGELSHTDAQSGMERVMGSMSVREKPDGTSSETTSPPDKGRRG